MKKTSPYYNNGVSEAIKLLNILYRSFKAVEPYADKYKHPHPTDTRAWSQLIVSALTGICGIERRKGADLEDGSDVKGANIWGAIDVPRFNGCIKAGTKSGVSGKMESLNDTPFIFFVLWDYEPNNKKERCRVWGVRPRVDKSFRCICQLWYRLRYEGTIKSNNFQLHPPINKNSSIITNNCGNLEYPLLFEAIRRKVGFEVSQFDIGILKSGLCKKLT
jgi:hypothetical protein